MKRIIIVFTAIVITTCAYSQVDTIRVKTKLSDTKSQHTNMQNNATDSIPDGVMMQNGKMLKVKNGQTTILDKEITMNNGTKVLPDGTCITKDYSKNMMKDGQHMDMAGNLIYFTIKQEINMYPVSDSTMNKSQL